MRLRETALLLRELNQQDPQGALDIAESMTPGVRSALSNCWQIDAHQYQLRPEGADGIWLLVGGRGSGKTHAGANDLLDVEEDWGSEFRGILCSKTLGDTRDVMIQGASGLAAQAAKRGTEIRYIANRALVELPNGGIAYVLSSEKPDKPRGYQSNYLWGDEISSWQNAPTTWMNLLFGWRLKTPDGRPPLAALTTTPKPNPITFLLLRDPKYRDRVTITRGRMADNKENLDAATIELLESVFEGTRLGRQELDGELVDMAGAIVEQDTIAAFRTPLAPQLDRIVVSLDPSIMDKETSDAAGIIVVGATYRDNPKGEAYVLDDRTIETAKFSDWAEATVRAFYEWNADCIVAEINQGGSGVLEAIEVAAEKISKEVGEIIICPVKSIWAKESKKARAEPVGALYERGRVHHVGILQQLEDELTTWMPGLPSPNRLDAVVHGVSHLLLGSDEPGSIRNYLVTL